jgi:hypothetical protein
MEMFIPSLVRRGKRVYTLNQLLKDGAAVSVSYFDSIFFPPEQSVLNDL